MLKLLELSLALRKASGGLAKKEVLRKYRGDSRVIEQLQYIFSPYKKYHVLPNVLEFFWQKNGRDPSWSAWKKILDRLAVEKSNSLKNQQVVRSFVESCGTEWGTLLLGFLTKELWGSGIGPATINAVLGRAVPSFGVALAKPWSLSDGLPFRQVFGSRKLDGVRVVAVVNEAGGVKYLSRKGHEFTSLGALTPILARFPGKVFDGECCVVEEDGTENFSAAVSAVKTRGPGGFCPRYYVFDMLTYEEYFQGKLSLPFSQRYNRLCRTLSGVGEDVKVVLQQEFSRPGEVNGFFEHSLSEGWEGIMLRDGAAPWEGKRSGALRKVKGFLEKEFRVTGVIEGQGQFKGSLGALRVVLPLGGEVDVGSGYTAAERKELWAKREGLVGAWITVKYFEVSQNASGGTSLRFPIFKGVRNYE